MPVEPRAGGAGGLVGGAARDDGRLDVELLAGRARGAGVDLHDGPGCGVAAADVHAETGAGRGDVEAAVHRVGGDVPVLRGAAVAGVEHQPGAGGAGARVEALRRVVHRRDGPAGAAGRHHEDRGGQTGRRVPLLNRRGAAVHDHRAAAGEHRRQRVLVAGVEHRRVVVVAPDGDAVLPDAARCWW